MSEEKKEQQKRILEFAEINMRCEGFCVSIESRDTAMKIINRQITADEVVLACIAKHQDA